MNHSYSKIQPLDYLELFLDSREERGCAKCTLADYRLAVRNLLSAPFIPTDLSELTPMHLDMWTAQLRKAGKTEATRNWYIQQARTFLRWLYKKRVTQLNLADEIEGVKVLTRNRPQVTASDMEKVLKTLEGRLTTKGEPAEHHYRDIALVRLLWSTGIRRSGIARLSFEDVSLELREIRVPAHADKKRTFHVVPFDTVTKSALLRYFVHERGKAPGPLFLMRGGEGMTPEAIHLMLRRVSEKAGVRVRAHGFRRALARRTRAMGMDIGETAALLGHRSLEQTRIYSGDGEGEAMIEAYRRMFG